MNAALPYLDNSCYGTGVEWEGRSVERICGLLDTVADYECQALE